MPVPVLDARRRMLRILEPGNATSDEARPSASKPEEQPEAARRYASILDPAYHIPAREQRLDRPMLITTIDAEEDFDWTRPFSRAATDVKSMRSQHRAHQVFERYGVIPVYMVDHPVASQDAGRAPLRELLRSGACDIGAQLHPWVTPPFVEDVSTRNSYAGNLPRPLEFAKIKVLTH
jgi:hypothetical protein